MDYPKSLTDVALHDGKFTDGTPDGSILPSRDPAKWANDVTDSILEVQAWTGEAHDEADITQMARGIDARIATAAFSIPALPDTAAAADADELAISVEGVHQRITVAELFEGRIGFDQVARDQIALTNMRQLLASSVATGAIVAGRQWELATDEWGATSTNETYVAASPAYYSNPGATVVETFGVVGTYTFTVPAGVTSLTQVDVVGAGGGGGGSLYNARYGGGGGGGGYSKITNVPVTPGQEITIVVGAKGLGGAAGASGAAGGQSAFAELATAGGGGGGTGLVANGPGGAGGTGTTANGQTGGTGSITVGSGYGGAGGGYAYGLAGASVASTDTVSPSGNPPGGGGAGAYNDTGRAGGNGADGLVKITYSAVPLDMTLAPPASVSLAADPTHADLYFLWKDDSGTAVLGTDITVNLSRDGGATKAAADLTVLAAFDGSYSFVRARADLSAQPAGTSLWGEILTHNTKAQRIAAPALYGE